MPRAVLPTMLLVSLAPCPSDAQVSLPMVAPVASCTSMRSFDPRLPEAPMHVTDAQGTEVDGKPMCVVRGYVSPQVKFEVRLPLRGWTQRYLQTGCGGLCGNLSIRAPQRPCPALERAEFVTASTDMGHDGGGGTWGTSDPQLRVDFAYRGVHVTAIVAKAMIAHFYGQGPRFSYFSGCSDGGREGMMEAQRYPEDFDGIAAGAPAFNFLVQNSFYHAWNARSVSPEYGIVTLLPNDLPVLHAAALAACDAGDGLEDGIISDPTGCDFDPASAECRTADPTGCLSHEAVVAAKAIYAGASDPVGRKLVVGGPQPGSELAWQGVWVPASADAPVFSATIASDMLRNLAYWTPLKPDWDLSQLRFSTETLEGFMPMHGLYDATDPDLSDFARSGGKLLLWHGWSDPHISPLNSVAYMQAARGLMGDAEASETLRLFLLPGMYHCRGGDGLTSIDVLTPLMEWVEDGRAPDDLVASRNDAEARAGKGRRIFPWPATSVVQAGGDPELPASWRPGPPLNVPADLHMRWAGARLFEPGYEKECGFEGPEFVCRETR